MKTSEWEHYNKLLRTRTTCFNCGEPISDDWECWCNDCVELSRNTRWNRLLTWAKSLKLDLFVKKMEDITFEIQNAENEES